MKNPRLEAAKDFLRKAGHDDISDETLQGLIDVVVDANPVEYEPGDFIVYNQGMGETGHAWIEQGRYPGGGHRIRLWHPDAAKRTITTGVSLSDIQGLSTEEDAMEYYLVRSGQK